MGRVITIGRQFGSGGHEVGLRLAKRLGYPFYDKELLTLTAENSRFAESYLAKMDEQKPSFLNLGSSGVIPGGSSAQGAMTQFYHLSPNDQIFLATSKVMHSLAEQGPCVIVGRCADYILKDRNDVLNVYIHAPMEARAERIVRLYGESEKKPEDRLKEKDSKRAINYKHFTGETWGDARNYDLCLNSEKIGIEKCVEMIIELAKQ